MENRLLTAEQVAQALNIGRTRAYELIWAGEIRSVKIGRLRRVPVDALDEYIATLGSDAA